MRITISILGCGWLGTALGKRLLSRRIIVKGSTTSNDHYNKLETTGIQPYYLQIEPDSIEVDYASFFNTDILIIAIPPKRVENIEEIFPKQIEQVIPYINKIGIPKVIFISSTSVYQSRNTTVKEDDDGKPEKASGIALLKAEKLLQNLENTKTTVLRFGGLIGAERNPASFLAHKAEVHARTPVNLIHRKDCISIIMEIIDKEIWGETFNACCPEHPTKMEFYAKAAKIAKMPVPVFTDKYENYKVVDSGKLIEKLDYNFEYPNPLDYLKELEEWTYRI